MFGTIFLEVGGLNGLIYVIIAIVFAITIISGAVITLITFIFNTFSDIKKTSKYYLQVFAISGLIALIVSGMICGSM